MEKKIILNSFQKYPLVVAIITQVFMLLILRNLFWLTKLSVTPWQFVFYQAISCSLISLLIFKLPKWFIYISILFPVCFMLSLSYLQLSSSFYGIIFVLLALTFSHTLKERVPLYLTNNTTYEALLKISNDHHSKKMVDLGSGLGGVVRALATNNLESEGVESAPLPWLFSSLLSIFTRKGKIHRQNIWQTNLSEYDLVYAFLSPAIMEKLFLKIEKEMKPGTLFISNSFAVPKKKPTDVWVLADKRETKLYLYKI